MYYLPFSSDNASDVVSNIAPPLNDTPPAFVMFLTPSHLYVATPSTQNMAQHEHGLTKNRQIEVTKNSGRIFVSPPKTGE